MQALLEQTGEEIVSGKIQPYPYRYKDNDGCMYCEYHSICQFSIQYQRKYCDLPVLKKEDVLQRIMEE